MATAERLEVRGKDKTRLRGWLRSTSIAAGLAQRARIVLLAGDGVPNTEIARRVGVSRPTVNHWRGRYLEGGVAALHGRPRPGRAREIDEIDVVAATLAEDGRPPERLRVTHWSARLLADELGLSADGVTCRSGDDLDVSLAGAVIMAWRLRWGRGFGL